MRKSFLSKAVVVALILIGGLLFAPNKDAQAGAKVVNIEGMDLTLKKNWVNNIRGCMDKNITVYLSSGHTISGKVKAVDNSFLLLKDIPQEEFMDILIDVNTVVGVKTQIRKYE
ncbi:MAG: hypothetical protein KKB30_01805 [Proteobacteria bacterium]|nr:hypothetical protein [Pseudomonadota bacterium]MBU1716329.1 hypothetical protein [Pseudomonadota bacterium]